MSKELIEINDRYIYAIHFHSCASGLYRYLSLSGFEALHLYQYFVEAQKQNNIRNFIINTYHLIPDEKVPDKLPQYFVGKHRLKITPTEVWDCVKSHMTEYRKLESENLIMYEKIASDLSKSGDIVGEQFVKSLVQDVHAELTHITDMILSLSAMDYDLPQIVESQADLKERYTYLISTIHKPYNAHHFNSDISYNKRGLRNDD